MIGCSYPQPRGRPYTGTGLGITACSLSDRVYGPLGSSWGGFGRLISETVAGCSRDRSIALRAAPGTGFPASRVIAAQMPEEAAQEASMADLFRSVVWLAMAIVFEVVQASSSC